MMPAGTDWPRMTARLIASRSMAMLMACRTRLSANGFLPLTLEVCSSGEPTFMPKKMVRFSGPRLTLRFGRLLQPVDVLHRHVLHEIDLARQQRRDARGVGLDHEIGDVGDAERNFALAPVGVVALEHGAHVLLARHQRVGAGAVGVADGEVVLLGLVVLHRDGVVRLRPLLVHHEQVGEVVGQQRVGPLGLDVHRVVVDLADACRWSVSSPFMSEVGCRARSSENTTSSALKALPLWNLTPWRSLNSHTVGSAVTFQETASVGSSLPACIADEQRLVDLVREVVRRALVLGVRIERQRIARACPLEAARIGRAGAEREGRSALCGI